MIGPRITRTRSRYEEAQYSLNFCTEDGLRAMVHVNRLKEGPSNAFEICVQGDKTYGAIAFFLYMSSWIGEKIYIKRLVSASEYSNET